MNETELTSLEQVEQFLSGTDQVTFTFRSKAACYQWIQQCLVRFRYLSLNKAEKGLLRRYLSKVSGYSRQQLTRLIKQYREKGKLQRGYHTNTGFARRYTSEDIALLAEVDELHGTLSGPATGCSHGLMY